MLDLASNGASALAQSASPPAFLTQLPECAIACLTSSIPKSHCQVTDQACMCQDSSLQQEITVCVTNTCSVTEGFTTKNVTMTACGQPVRNRGSDYARSSIASGTIVVVFIIARVAYKIWAKTKLGLDDWFAVFTCLLGVPSAVLTHTNLIPDGLGRDIWTVSSSHITDFIRVFFVMEVFYFFQVACLKVTLLFFYIKIFPFQEVRRLLWGTLIFTAIFGITFTLVGVFQCQPISYYWTKWDGEHTGKCVSIDAVVWSNAAISIALDIWMLIIPLWQLKHLPLSWLRKLGVALMFVLGTFVTVVSILRLKSLIKFGTATQNPTWDFYETCIWSTMEMDVGIICTCLPTMRLMCSRLLSWMRNDTSSNGSVNGAASDFSGKYSLRPPPNSLIRQLKGINSQFGGDFNDVKRQYSNSSEP